VCMIPEPFKALSFFPILPSSIPMNSSISKCLGCDSTSVDIVASSSLYSLCICIDCRLVFKHIARLDYNLRQDLQDSVYTEEYVAGRLTNPTTLEMADQRVRFLSKFVGKGKLLEIGCGTGEFLELAKKVGFDVEGVEASQLIIEFLRSHGISARKGVFEELDWARSTYTVIAGFHLFEHIHLPNRFLQRVHRSLVDFGFLFLVTPNVESKTDRLFGWRHPTFTMPDHICFYSPSTLSAILERNGFKVMKIETFEPLHHLFTSVNAFFAQKDNKFLRSVAQLVRPYWLASALSPIMRKRAWRLENSLTGHELFVIARKV